MGFSSKVVARHPRELVSIDWFRRTAPGGSRAVTPPQKISLEEVCSQLSFPIWENRKTKEMAVPVGCIRLLFNPLFAPFGTTLWTFPRGNVQSTLWERFT
jgi:hypothetical protein